MREIEREWQTLMWKQRECTTWQTKTQNKAQTITQQPAKATSAEQFVVVVVTVLCACHGLAPNRVKSMCVRPRVLRGAHVHFGFGLGGLTWICGSSSLSSAFDILHCDNLRFTCQFQKCWLYVAIWDSDTADTAFQFQLVFTFVANCCLLYLRFYSISLHLHFHLHLLAGVMICYVRFACGRYA